MKGGLYLDIESMLAFLRDSLIFGLAPIADIANWCKAVFRAFRS